VLTANTGGGNVWKDLLKYNYRIGVNYFNSVIIVNKDRFNKLPPDVQAKVRKIVTDNMALITSAMQAEEEGLTKKFADGGMVITRESKVDLEQGMKVIAPYWDEWAKTKGPEAVEALKQVRAALGR
jgi:TRAP-type transport system periplasmic protein